MVNCIKAMTQTHTRGENDLTYTRDKNNLTDTNSKKNKNLTLRKRRENLLKINKNIRKILMTE